MVPEARLERVIGRVNGTQSILLSTAASYVSEAAAPPATGAMVRVSDDAGDQGKINGGKVFEGATNKDGQLKATFVKTAGGQGAVRPTR